MNAYLLRVYYNMELKKKKPKEVWVKSLDINKFIKTMKEKHDIIREIEVLQKMWLKSIDLWLRKW